MEKNKTCCFTGHRPNKFSFGYNENHADCIKLKKILQEEILAKIDKGVNTFICGMAMGVDIWCGEFVAEIKGKYKLKLVAAIPFLQQSDSFSRDYKMRYKNILRKCDDYEIITPQFEKWSFIKRNTYMVDNSGHMIGVFFPGEKGGTKFTVDYAFKKKISVSLINPKDFSVSYY